ncbi:MAG: hypothetical protein ACRDZQ_09125 [Acidimicrobiales bacterium]
MPTTGAQASPVVFHGETAPPAAPVTAIQEAPIRTGGGYMAFIQIVELTTEDYAAVKKVDEAWIAATQGKRTARRQIVGRDRNDPNRYVGLVFFDSYESAMENSALPETQAFAQQYGDVTTSTTFHDLEVIGDVEL